MSKNLFPLDPTEDQRAELIDNILAVYRRASDDQRARGMAWYQTAHELAEIVGGGDAIKGAGLIAALSPNNSWDNNKRQAVQFSSSPDEVRALGESLSRATLIAAGGRPLDVLQGPKTRAFWANIAHPTRSLGRVTIDRHAHDLARNERFGSLDRGLRTKKRYDIFQDAYGQAATQLNGIRPHELQAITWLVWREEK